jgi:hypothetical protein
MPGAGAIAIIGAGSTTGGPLAAVPRQTKVIPTPAQVIAEMQAAWEAAQQWSDEEVAR